MQRQDVPGKDFLLDNWLTPGKVAKQLQGLVVEKMMQSRKRKVVHSPYRKTLEYNGINAERSGSPTHLRTCVLHWLKEEYKLLGRFTAQSEALIQGRSGCCIVYQGMQSFNTKTGYYKTMLLW